jgi:hypothetical protein
MIGREKQPVEVVIADTADIFGFPNQDAFQKYIDSYINSGTYKAVLFENRYLVIIHNKYTLPR